MSLLTRNLREMLRLARAAEGRPIRRSLPDGLTLEVLQAATGDVVLTLARRDHAPAAAEYQRVLGQWPEAVPAHTPVPRSEGRRHALVGRWPRPVAEIGEPAAG